MSTTYPIAPLPLLVLRNALLRNERETMFKVCIKSLNKAGYITIGDVLNTSQEQLESALVHPGRVHLIKILLERAAATPGKIVDVELYDRQTREAIVQKTRLE